MWPSKSHMLEFKFEVSVIERTKTKAGPLHPALRQNDRINQVLVPGARCPVPGAVQYTR